MIASIHQPLYLPWQPYFGKIASSGVFVVLDDVQYPRGRGFFNRNAVKTAQGPTLLTVPVKSRGEMALVNEIEIDASQDWAKKHFKTISLSYAKAPYFAAHRAALEDFYLGRRWERFGEMTTAFIRLVSGLLELKTKIVLASELGVPGQGAERLIGLVKAAGADEYLTGQGAGSDRYMDETLYARAGLRVLYHGYRQEPYPQLWGAFAPDLSILDLLLNLGPASRDFLIKNSATEESHGR